MREHKDDGFNNGVYQADESSLAGLNASDSHVAAEVSPGKAYVKGYRTQTLSPTYVDIPKARDTNAVQNTIIPFELAQSVLVTNIYGWPLLTGPNVTYNYQVLELRDNWNPSGEGTPQGNIIGFARCAQLSNELTNGGIANATQGNMLHIFDVQMYTVLNLSLIHI